MGFNAQSTMAVISGRESERKSVWGGGGGGGGGRECMNVHACVHARARVCVCVCVCVLTTVYAVLLHLLVEVIQFGL